jgi:hypothetical protein
MDRRYTLDDFLPQVGKPFHLRYPDHSDTLTLEDAHPAKIQIPGFPLGFFLHFSGANTNVMLSQHAYLLENDGLGALRILLTPMRRRDDGVFIYEAVFN